MIEKGTEPEQRKKMNLRVSWMSKGTVGVRSYI